VTTSSNRTARAGIAALAFVAFVAARPAGAADDPIDAAMARLDRGDLAGAIALAQAACERAPDDANGWLALGCCEASAKEWPSAVQAFARAGRAGAGGGGEVALRARFDLAKALFEQARATPLPAAPEHGTPAPSEVADARTRLAIVRLELESARDALIAVLDAAPADDEARRGLAAATARLREVVALDAKWRAKSTPPNEAARGEGTPARGPLKRGPSGTKSSAGASGKRAGESSDGANGAAPGTTGSDAPSGIGAAPLRPDEEQRLADELKRAFEERARSDARRADARARLRGVQN
jgi:tetratricopeptide (TPR) repeat protein